MKTLLKTFRLTLQVKSYLEMKDNQYLCIVENLQNFMIYLWESKIQAFLDLNQQWWFLGRIFLMEKVQFRDIGFGMGSSRF